MGVVKTEIIIGVVMGVVKTDHFYQIDIAGM